MHVIEFAFGRGRGKDKKKRKKRMQKAFKSFGKKLNRAEGSLVKRASKGLNSFQTTKAGVQGVKTGVKTGMRAGNLAKKVGASKKNQERAANAGASVGVRAGVYGSLAKQQASRVRFNKPKYMK